LPVFRGKFHALASMARKFFDTDQSDDY